MDTTEISNNKSAIWQTTHGFLLVFYCNYVSILCHLQDIIDYFQKFIAVMWL